MRFAGKLSPEDFWRRRAAGDERVRVAAHLLPLYGIAGWDGPLMTGGWQWSDGELESAGLSHGTPNESSLQVVTTSGDPARIAHTLRMTGELVLEGRNLDPPALRLERVTDVEPYLAGRSAYIRRLRGED
ncbi:MAG: hypothetical protein JWO79_3988 [Actinomycetia bacterium]|nr:hypothetical protein [Actinomycetes bacterium]